MGASPLPEQSSRPLNRSWSTNLKNGRVDSLRAKPQGRSGPIARMASVDSFHLSDLNGGRGPSRMGAPALSRIASMSSLRTDDYERGGGGQSQAGTPMSRATTGPLSQLSPAPARGQGVVDRAKDRQLQHQMSLQCISTAIASATARRTGLSPISQASDMGDEMQVQQQEAWDEGAQRHYYGGGGQEIYDDNGSLLQLEVYPTDGLGIQLDDLDEVPDGDSPYLEDENDHHSPEDLAYLGESDDELDTFMQSRFSEDEGDDYDVQPVSRSAKPPASPRWSERPGLAAEPVVTRSPAVRSRASSPIKAPLSVDVVASPRSAMRRPSETFAFATPNSPVKAHVDLPPVSPLHFDSADRDNESMPPPPSRSARPLPHRPSPTVGPTSPSKSSMRNQTTELTKQPSTSSLKRSSNVIRKTPSTRSLRHTASDAQLPELDFGEPSASDSETHPTPITTSRTSPALSSRSSSSRTSRTSTMPPPTSPRKVVVARSSASAASSPASLRSTRSISDFRSASAPLPPPTRKSSVLPSVKNKISALETREATLSKLANASGRAKVNASQLDRSDSVSSQVTNATSETSFKLSDLTRGNSMASFKAPILRRNFSDMPPLPTTRF